MNNEGDRVARRIALPLLLRDVSVGGRFWDARLHILRDATLPYQWRALNDEITEFGPNHALRNLRIAAGREEGQILGFRFQDSDIAKWLEAVGNVLSGNQDVGLKRLADSIVDLLEEAQLDDGYLNSFFSLGTHGKRWSNVRDNHELYCAGHLIEAAIAYCEGTGDRRFLDCACRLADHIDRTFGPRDDQIHGYPGHQEIELALVRLYRTTDERRYLTLAKYFLDQRGQRPHFFDIEAAARGRASNADGVPWDGFEKSYWQAHLPVREQRHAVGHAVRAMYMYSAMVDVAVETSDDTLLHACDLLWKNVTERQMYVTGGIGAEERGEAFTFDFDLPNDTAYAETCAGIGFIFWAYRMLNVYRKARYADVMERVLFNGVLSGFALDGSRFFYVNPLQVWPEAVDRRHDKKHVKPVRQPWYPCACCPPNISRFLTSLGRFVYSTLESTLYVHLFVQGTARFDLDGHQVLVEQETDYPWSGVVRLNVHADAGAALSVAVRIPGWCRAAQLRINGETVELEPILRDGYAHLSPAWTGNDRIEIDLSMPIERVYADSRLRENAGRIALQRGPIVYCLEEADNGPVLNSLELPRSSELKLGPADPELDGAPTIQGEGLRSSTDAAEQLYSTEAPLTEPVLITAIPYHAWGNRGLGEMLVWIRERDD